MHTLIATLTDPYYSVSLEAQEHGPDSHNGIFREMIEFESYSLYR